MSLPWALNRLVSWPQEAEDLVQYVLCRRPPCLAGRPHRGPDDKQDDQYRPEGTVCQRLVTTPAANKQVAVDVQIQTMVDQRLRTPVFAKTGVTEYC